MAVAGAATASILDSRALTFKYVHPPGDEHNCAICFMPYATPEQTTCRHIFCRACIRVCLAQSPQCPVCRATASLYSPESQLQAYNGPEVAALNMLPVHCTHRGSGCTFEGPRKSYAAHLKECTHEKRWRAAEAERRQRMVSLVVGNTHITRRLGREGRNSHSWKAYVRGSTVSDGQKIKKVVFHLHPTFTPHRVECSRAPFEIGRLGYGTFNIPIEVHMKDGVVHRLEHSLSFRSSGARKKYTLEQGQAVAAWQRGAREVSGR